MPELQELIEQMRAGNEWPSPDILEEIVAHGEAAIDPLREIVRAGAKKPEETEYVDPAVGLLGDLQAVSAGFRCVCTRADLL